MTIRDILNFPNPRLRQFAAAVFDDALTALSAELLDTMRAAPGIDVAGPHIGELPFLN